MYLPRLTLVFSCICASVSACSDVTKRYNDSDKLDSMASTIKEVKQQHQDAWLAHPQVVSVGIGLNAEKQPAIIVGVKSALEDGDERFPEFIDGYPVEVHVIGSPLAE